jgi:hypothetical protein
LTYMVYVKFFRSWYSAKIFLCNRSMYMNGSMNGTSNGRNGGQQQQQKQQQQYQQQQRNDGKPKPVHELRLGSVPRSGRTKPRIVYVLTSRYLGFTWIRRLANGQIRIHLAAMIYLCLQKCSTKLTLGFTSKIQVTIINNNTAISF